MNKIILSLILILISLNSVFAITTDITFHSKFEKPQEKITELNFNGFPAHSFKQHETKYSLVKDNRYEEKDYFDFKREYNNQRKGNFNQKYQVPKDLYKFKKNYRDNEYKEYKREYNSQNWAMINYFKENGFKFKTSENYEKNNY